MKAAGENGWGTASGRPRSVRCPQRAYHGGDDVGDVRGSEALGGGGDEDLRDGILTLPAAFAIRDPRIAAIFCRPDPSDDELRAMAEAFRSRLPEAERYLDAIADEARQEARQLSANPGPLLALVDHTPAALEPLAATPPRAAASWATRERRASC